MNCMSYSPHNLTTNKQFFYLKEEIEELLKEMDKIENNLDKIKAVMLSKEKVDELGNKCLYKMQILYDSLNDFIYWESCFWDKIDLEKKKKS